MLLIQPGIGFFIADPKTIHFGFDHGGMPPFGFNDVDEGTRFAKFPYHSRINRFGTILVVKRSNQRLLICFGNRE